MCSLLIASDSMLTHNDNGDHIQQGSKYYASVAYVRILLLLTGFPLQLVIWMQCKLFSRNYRLFCVLFASAANLCHFVLHELHVVYHFH